MSTSIDLALVALTTLMASLVALGAARSARRAGVEARTAPFTALASWPVVWIPAFLAPLALFLHVVSLRQGLGVLRAGPLAPRTSP